MQATKEGIQVTKIVAPAAMEGEDPHGGGATHESHYFDVHKLRGAASRTSRTTLMCTC